MVCFLGLGKEGYYLCMHIEKVRSSINKYFDMSRCKKSKMSLKFCSAESNPFLDGHIDQLFHPITNLDEMGLVCCPF